MGKSSLPKRNLLTFVGGILAGGGLGALAGYLLYILTWWVWGWIVSFIQPQNAFIYQRPPDSGPHAWWVLIGAFFGIASAGILVLQNLRNPER